MHCLPLLWPVFHFYECWKKIIEPLPKSYAFSQMGFGLKQHVETAPHTFFSRHRRMGGCAVNPEQWTYLFEHKVRPFGHELTIHSRRSAAILMATRLRLKHLAVGIIAHWRCAISRHCHRRFASPSGQFSAAHSARLVSRLSCCIFPLIRLISHSGLVHDKPDPSRASTACRSTSPRAQWSGWRALKHVIKRNDISRIVCSVCGISTCFQGRG